MRANRVSQRDLAAVLEVSEQAVSDKFHGRSSFTLRDLRRIADYFDVSLDYLAGRSDIKQPLGGEVMAVFARGSHNHFDVDRFEVDNSFGFRISVDGDYFTVSGMSLGDLVAVNRRIAEAIKAGRRHEVEAAAMDGCGVAE